MSRWNFTFGLSFWQLLMKSLLSVGGPAGAPSCCCHWAVLPVPPALPVVPPGAGPPASPERGMPGGGRRRALGASSASPAPADFCPILLLGLPGTLPAFKRGMSGRPTPAAKGAGLTVGTPVWACAGCEERAPATNSTARAVIAEKRRSFMALGCTSVTGSCNRARSGARGVRSRGSRWRSSSASRTSPGPCWGWRSRPR
jgi:hypothetical protein